MGLSLLGGAGWRRRRGGFGHVDNDARLVRCQIVEANIAEQIYTCAIALYKISGPSLRVVYICKVQPYTTEIPAISCRS